MRISNILTAGAIAVAAILAGCSPSLTTMAPAQTARAGHLRATASVDVATAPSDVRELAQEMQALSEQSPEEASGNRQEIERVVEETATAIVAPPSIGARAAVAFGVTDWLEVGVSSSVNALRGHLRLQLFELEDPGFYGVASIGGGAHLMGYPVGMMTDHIQLEEFSRYDLEASVHVGFSGRIGHVWAGPKVVRSTYTLGYSACVRSSSNGCQEEARVGLDGTATYMGGQIGVALGGRSTMFSIEMTAMRLAVDANLHAEAMGFNGDRQVQSDGWVFSPSVGVMMMF
jgi:hypothetical protein